MSDREVGKVIGRYGEIGVTQREDGVTIRFRPKDAEGKRGTVYAIRINQEQAADLAGLLNNAAYNPA